MQMTAQKKWRWRRRGSTNACTGRGGGWRLGSAGAQWRELPSKNPPYQTVHGRFQQWVRSGQLEKALRVVAERLRQAGKLDPGEGCIDGSFAAAK